MNKQFKIGLATLALVCAPLTANAVFAQTTGTTSAAAKVMDFSKVFVQKLAAALGVDQAKLEAAMKTAGNATVDDALSKQEITKAQADAMKARVQAGEYNFFSRGPGGFDGRGPGGGNRDGGRNGGPNGLLGGDGTHVHPVVMDAAAKALGLTSEELRTQVQAGKTITEIAAAKKVDVKTVQAAVIAAYKTQLDAAVKAGKLTQVQADERLKTAQADPNFGLEFGHGRGGPRR
jgi:hypothetical protein